MAPKTQKTDRTPMARRPPKNPQKSKQNSPRPTHFLSLPLTGSRSSNRRLLPSGDTNPAIEGLDQSILVDPRRLHLTIGVMALSSTESPTQQSNTSGPGKTVSEAIALLHSLGPEIDTITREPVPLTLDKMGVLKTQRQQAGVLYVGPSDEITEDAVKVGRIFDLVGQRFRQEGFVEEAARPAVLHCTLINASHRKPRRMPRTFSYREIFDRASVDASSPTTSEPPPASGDRSIKVDFGSWAVSEIQLCRMGSHGPENEYISVGSLPVGRN
ncbi:kinase A anchor protein [Mycena olivaceomarginata]|nr:kinase A anchor protein [Mycena olivaceomarginata]